MKKNILFLLAALFTFTTAAFSQSTTEADQIIGTWQTAEKDGKIEIYKQGNKYFGKLTWGARIFEADGKTSKKDVKNPEKSLQGRNLQNLVILTDFDFEGGKWENGKIYDPESGKTYSCVMKLDNKRLKITGYIGFSWIGKTVLWDRI